jgi:hypothetical protein
MENFTYALRLRLRVNYMIYSKENGGQNCPRDPNTMDLNSACVALTDEEIGQCHAASEDWGHQDAEKLPDPFAEGRL